MAETDVSPEKLILPIFVTDVRSLEQEIPSLPGHARNSIDAALKVCEMCCESGVSAVALFPVIDPSLKSTTADECFNANGLVPKAVEKIKSTFPELGVITDVALDPYTTHGQDGIINADGYVMNDETTEILTKQALAHARAGADMIAPSDMMDGRVGAIRTTFEKYQFHNTRILSYAAKYASHYYGPFRDAVGSSGNLKKADKKQYQMDPRNSHEALREVALDIQEGADMVMVKPAGLYLDIIHRVKHTFQIPTLGYQVSGEYTMLKSAADAGFIDEKMCALEALYAIRRAGADGILTYYALEAANWLKQDGPNLW